MREMQFIQRTLLLLLTATLGVGNITAQPAKTTSSNTNVRGTHASTYYMQAKALEKANPQKALDFAEKALASKDSDDEKLRSSILTLTGDIYYRLSQFQQAIDKYTECLQIAAISSNKGKKAEIIRYIGVCYYAMGLPEKALNEFSKTLAIGQELNDVALLASAYNNIGLTYMDSQDNQKAREFFFKAVSYYDKTNAPEKRGLILLNIGNTFMNEDDTVNAEKYYLDAYRAAVKYNITQQLALSAQNLAQTSEYQKKYTQALAYSNQALNAYRKLNDQFGTSVILSNLGNLFVVWGKLSQAEPYLLESLQIAEKINALPTLEHCYKTLGNYYETKKDYAKALDYQKKLRNVTDNLYTISRDKLLLEMQTKYAVNEKEKENKQLRTTLLIAVSFGTLLVITILIAFLIKRRSGRLLAEKNKELKEANDTKDLFFSILAHDLKNSLGGFVTFSQLLSSHSDSFSEEEKQKFYHEMKKMAEGLYSLLENLLEWARTQTGALKITPSAFNISEVIMEAKTPYHAAIEKKKLQLTLNLDDSICITSDRNLLGTIVRNLIGNAVKYTRPEGYIMVSTALTDNRIQIEVRDHGVGIPDEILHKIFSIDNRYRTRGTNDEPGTGLGLILSQEFTRMLGGTLTVTSKLGEGSTFMLSVPIRLQHSHL